MTHGTESRTRRSLAYQTEAERLCHLRRAEEKRARKARKLTALLKSAPTGQQGVG